MWKFIPNSFHCESKGLLRSILDKRNKYQEVVKSKNFRFASDFCIDQSNGSSTRTKKNLKTYGSLSRTPTKQELIQGKNIYEGLPEELAKDPTVVEVYLGEEAKHLKQLMQ